MESKLSVDLNCDLGEGFGQWTFGNDEQILPYISSANIACGLHAGDPSTIMKTIELALQHNVKIGAHPGLNDKDGFGRREIQVTPKEVYDLTVYQIAALAGCAKSLGTKLNHVKPHGALYNMAAKDSLLAKAICQAVYSFDPDLILYGLSGSLLVKEARSIGLQVFSEVFADRSYQQDGSLTPRSLHHAIIRDQNLVIDQVLKMVKFGKVESFDGHEIEIHADTICLHGDNMAAVELARAIATTLKQEKIEIG
ncbi:LamB/YcsF family protein [Sphingobacterium sp. LRF_L2]|uniref:LamB/YcsF family protein n=1 Tax=Sphingobacterium sp. LRF_L2 TaxID=3369421 RepID=UPI003F5FBC9B